MRALVADLIEESLTPTSLVPEGSWLGSKGVDGTPPRPFAELRWGGRFPGMGSVRRRRLEVWVHTDEGDYDPIERQLQEVRDVLDGMAHKTDAAGNEIILCTWVNDSPDLFDDGYRTICMMSAYEIVGKDAP